MKALWALFFALWLSAAVCGAGESGLAVSRGDFFPDIAFEGLVTAEDYALLGLPQRSGAFRLSEVAGELLILEFFNRYCLTCWRQAPQIESLLRLAEPGDLKGRVRVLSVGAGNGTRDLLEFRAEHKVTYPLSPDAQFDRYRELGDIEGMPLTVFLRKRDGRWVLADDHVGFYGDVEMLARARILLLGGADAPKQAVREGVPDPAEAAGAADRVKSFLAQVAGRAVDVEPVDLGGRVRVFRAADPTGKSQTLYGRLASRLPLCDLCHTIRFLVAFDSEGRVRGFEPVFVTKFGNETWSDDETRGFAARLAGKSMDELPYDAKVDAVTSATMSSALIYDEVRRLGLALKQFDRDEEGGGR